MLQLGIDFASMDVPTAPDIAAAVAGGTRFAYARRSHCYYDQINRAWRLAHDPVATRDVPRLRDAGVVVGQYLFPSFHRDAPNVEAQVANFQSSGPAIMKGKDLPPALDVEFPGKGIQDTLRPQGEVFKLVLEYVRALRAAYGNSPIIYTSHVQWHDSNGLGGPTHEEISACPLWLKT